ncbi:MAG: hypothetical protein HOV68_27845, partial [Streptomycetaceae bacterium]|nr:hypothetical protein [Streptomycetaceae bacterium]
MNGELTRRRAEATETAAAIPAATDMTETTRETARETAARTGPASPVGTGRGAPEPGSCVIALDVGGTVVKGGLVGPDGAFVRTERRATG